MCGIEDIDMIITDSLAPAATVQAFEQAGIKIVNNGIYDPTGEHRGAKGDFIAPEFWWDGSELDSLFIDAVAKPQGMILEMEKDIGRYAGGLDLTDNGDVQRGKAALWMLRNMLAPVIGQKPFFMSAHFASFNESAHVNGVYSREAAESLQKIDAMLGQIIEEAEKLTDGRLVVCVVSDHGSLDNTHNISSNVLLHDAGLTIKHALRYGVARGLYSNEAGEGSAAVLHAAAKVDHPARQGMYGLVEVFIDTILLCSTTGFTVLITGVNEAHTDASTLAAAAFGATIPGLQFVIYLCLLLFCGTSIMSQWYFGHVSLKYLKHSHGAAIYRVIFPFLILLGSLSTIDMVWDIQDCALGLLIIPNVIALVILGPEVRGMLREFTDPANRYLSEEAAGRKH